MSENNPGQLILELHTHIKDAVEAHFHGTYKVIAIRADLRIDYALVFRDHLSPPTFSQEMMGLDSDFTVTARHTKRLTDYVECRVIVDDAGPIRIEHIIKSHP